MKEKSRKNITFILGIAVIAALSGCSRVSNEAPGEEIGLDSQTSAEETSSVEARSEETSEDTTEEEPSEVPEQ